MAKTNLTAQRLRELLHYDPKTGDFIRIKITSTHGGAGKAKVGAPAGHVNGIGYVVMKIGVVAYKGHRLAWLYVYGEWPSGMLDHINRNKSDNRIGNLRDVDSMRNQQNTGTPKTNTSGFKGAFKVNRGGKRAWKSTIRVNGKQFYLGAFDCPEAAHAAYKEAAAKFHTAILS